MSATNASCQLIKRNPLNGTMEGDLIYGVSQVTQNIGNVHAEGIDYGIHYSWDLGNWGGLDIALDGTHVLTSSYVPAPGGAEVDCIAHYGKQCGLPSTVSASTGGPTPEDHFVQRTTWTFGPFDLGYNWRYLSGSTVDPTQAAATDPVSSRIGDFNYVDLQAGWQVTDWAKLKFGVTNVFDKDAPFVVTETGSTTFNSGNTYPSTYDVLGRVFTVGFTTKF
jgi:outer membrane receptor protein involved in Fe transport